MEGAWVVSDIRGPDCGIGFYSWADAIKHAIWTARRYRRKQRVKWCK